MKASRTKTARQRPRRRWRTPPPLTRGSETFEGIDLLRENTGDAGLLLWQAYRNVMFWASTDPDERGDVFVEGAGEKRAAEVRAADLPEALVEPLLTVGRMVGAPADTEGGEVAEACLAIAEWARERGSSATELSFTQAAALATPRDARLPFLVGQIARRREEMARAETWFRHAIMIGRQVGDWDSYSRSYIALGNMLLKRGNYPGAYRMHIKALRASRRKGLLETQGMALHDLFVIADHTGKDSQAQEYARQAFRAYGPEHPRLPHLAGDVAYFWMERGDFEHSLHVFQALSPHFTTVRDRLITVSNIARAAGGTGQKEVFRKAWTEANRMARNDDVREVAPSCMLELAHGAASLGEWDRAEQAADQALHLATEQKQAKTRLRAEGLLESVRNNRLVSEKLSEQEIDSQEIASLAGDLVRSLEGSAATI